MLESSRRVLSFVRLFTAAGRSLREFDDIFNDWTQENGSTRRAQTRNTEERILSSRGVRKHWSRPLSAGMKERVEKADVAEKTDAVRETKPYTEKIRKPTVVHSASTVRSFFSDLPGNMVGATREQDTTSIKNYLVEDM